MDWKAKGRKVVPADYVLDQWATRAGYDYTDDFKEAVYRAAGRSRRLHDLELQIANYKDDLRVIAAGRLPTEITGEMPTGMAGQMPMEGIPGAAAQAELLPEFGRQPETAGQRAAPMVDVEQARIRAERERLMAQGQQEMGAGEVAAAAGAGEPLR